MPAQSCLTLCNPVGCSPPGSFVHGILQARKLEWAAISSSSGSYWPRGRTCVSCISCIGKRILYYCATWEAVHIHTYMYFNCPFLLTRMWSLWGLIFLYVLFILKYIYFILGIIWYLFLVVLGLSLVVQSRAYSSLWYVGVTLRWLLLLWSSGSRCTGPRGSGTGAP